MTNTTRLFPTLLPVPPADSQQVTLLGGLTAGVRDGTVTRLGGLAGGIGGGDSRPIVIPQAK